MPSVSTPTSRAVVLRGSLVGVCSALFTLAAHAAGGGAPTGTPMSLMILMCATVGAAVSTVTVERYLTKVMMLAGAVTAAQVLGHVALSAASHHGVHDAPLSTPMVFSHLFAAVTLAILIALAEFLYQVCGSVLCWLRLVAIHRGRSHAPLLLGRHVVMIRQTLLRSGLGMRAPPTGSAAGV